MKYLVVEKGWRMRMIKTHAFSAAANTTTTVDWDIPQLRYPDTTQTLKDVSTFMNGVEYYINGSHIDDELKFQVVHPVAGIIDEFGHVAAIDGKHQIESYIARLPAGLKIRLVYINTGNAAVEVRMNLFRHINTDEVS